MAYHGLGEATKKKTAEQLPCCRVPELRSLLDEGFVVGFGALDDLDLCNIGLRISIRQVIMLSNIRLWGHTESAIFSTVLFTPLTSSEGDMLKMSLLERMNCREMAVITDEKRRSRNHGDSSYSYTKDSNAVFPVQGTPAGSGAARLAAKRLIVGDMGEDRVLIWARMTALRAYGPGGRRMYL